MRGNKVFFSVAAPAYNEQDILEDVIRSWQQVLQACDFETEIVIGNDGSTDRTKEILNRLCEEFSNLRVVHSRCNGGYGDALFRAVYASRGQYVATIDSDGQFEMGDCLRLLLECVDGGYDAVTGYRMGKKDTWLRVLADRALNLIVRILFRVDYRDTNCASKVFRGDLIRKMIIEAKSYPTPTEVLLRLVEKGAHIGQAGVQHRQRKKGKSHLKLFRTGLDMFSFLIYLRMKLFLKRARIIDSF